LVYRDIKPDNILVSGKDRHILLKIGDLGLCKKTDEDGNFPQNSDTVKRGNPKYMTLERIIVKIQAKKKIDLKTYPMEKSPATHPASTGHCWEVTMKLPLLAL
jgi:serine/threonine protein kinase